MASDPEGPDLPTATGRVKWFDRTKGFGFILDDAGGSDILLNANVLRDFGQSSVGEGAEVTVTIVTTPKGKQAHSILALVPAETGDPETPVGEGPLLPARVKWFDKVRGFGFANVFGASDDVFVHAETVRRAGLAEVQAGEAIAIRVTDGPRGRMATEIVPWDRSIEEVPWDRSIEEDEDGDDDAQDD